MDISKWWVYNLKRLQCKDNKAVLAMWEKYPQPCLFKLTVYYIALSKVQTSRWEIMNNDQKCAQSGSWGKIFAVSVNRAGPTSAEKSKN